MKHKIIQLIAHENEVATDFHRRVERLLDEQARHGWQFITKDGCDFYFRRAE